jgi:hypothetical protein
MVARNAGTLVGFALTALLTGSGCIQGVDVTIVGQTGVSVDEDGRPLVIVAACKDHLNFIDIYFDREGLKETEPNKKVGTWTSSSPITKTFVFDIKSPGLVWTPRQGVTIEPGRGYIVEAAATDADFAATQVGFKGADLSKMRTDSVYTNVSDPDSEKFKRYDRATFRADVCR